VKWDSISKIKEDGGLGVKDLKLLNMEKWKWRLRKEDKWLWKDILD